MTRPTGAWRPGWWWNCPKPWTSAPPDCEKTDIAVAVRGTAHASRGPPDQGAAKQEWRAGGTASHTADPGQGRVICMKRPGADPESGADPACPGRCPGDLHGPSSSASPARAPRPGRGGSASWARWMGTPDCDSPLRPATTCSPARLLDPRRHGAERSERCAAGRPGNRPKAPRWTTTPCLPGSLPPPPKHSEEVARDDATVWGQRT